MMQQRGFAGFVKVSCVLIDFQLVNCLFCKSKINNSHFSKCRSIPEHFPKQFKLLEAIMVASIRKHVPMGFVFLMGML